MDAIGYADYHFEDDVDFVDLLERLSEYGDLTANANLGVRFEPSQEGWPPTYFSMDGHIHVVARRLGLRDLMTYIRFLSDVAGTGIVEDATTH